MTAAPETVTLDAPLTAAARLMAEKDIGDVIVIEPGTERVAGIVTDRDIAIRAVAQGRNPDTHDRRGDLQPGPRRRRPDWVGQRWRGRGC